MRWLKASVAEVGAEKSKSCQLQGFALPLLLAVKTLSLDKKREATKKYRKVGAGIHGIWWHNERGTGRGRAHLPQVSVDSLA